MTEAEWLECTDLRQMLEFGRDTSLHVVGRLLGCEIAVQMDMECRCISSLMSNR